MIIKSKDQKIIPCTQNPPYFGYNMLIFPTTVVYAPGYACTAGEGNGTLLQYSCLENPMDGGAW